MAPNHGKVLSEEEHSKAVAAFQALGVCQQLADAAACLGWKSPSAIQEQAVPLVLQGACWCVQWWWWGGEGSARACACVLLQEAQRCVHRPRSHAYPASPAPCPATHPLQTRT